MKSIKGILVISLVMLLFMSSCEFPLPAMSGTNETSASEASKLEVSGLESQGNATLAQTATSTPTIQVPTATQEPTPTCTATSTFTSTPELPAAVGPENFPEDVNPLTGLRVEEPELLLLPPATISVSNFPASARPQAGLSFSPIIYELTIGEGMTRFLATFYGEFPGAVSGQTEGDPASGGSAAGSGVIGPIRSGRLPFESLRAQLNGFLVMASAYQGVAATLNESTSIFGSDSDDINSALIGVDQLEKIAQAQYERSGKSPYLDGMAFDETVPDGGLAAENIWIYYSFLNQIQWDYDPALGKFIRSDITTDGSETFIVSTDRLTGDPLGKENIVILFAEHDYKAPTLIDIELDNVPQGKAILFRDGQMFELFWTSKYGDFEKETGLLRPIRFMDAEGKTFPFKPGQTWVHIVSLATIAWEAENNGHPFRPIIEQAGSALWAIRYYGKY